VIDGMTIDSKGLIYEKNPLFYQIRKFDPTGILIRSFSHPRKGDKIEDYRYGDFSNGPFFLQKGLLVIQRGRVVDLFDEDGNFLSGDIPLRHKILMAKGNMLFLEAQREDNGNDERANPLILQAILRSP
jgi:hypothetical protein